jgi:hypothetical protein
LEGGGGISGGWERETQEIFSSFIIFFLFLQEKKKITLGEPLLETNNNGALGEKRAASR